MGVEAIAAQPPAGATVRRSYRCPLDTTRDEDRRRFRTGRSASRLAVTRQGAVHGSMATRLRGWEAHSVANHRVPVATAAAVAQPVRVAGEARRCRSAEPGFDDRAKRGQPGLASAFPTGARVDGFAAAVAAVVVADGIAEIGRKLEVGQRSRMALADRGHHSCHRRKDRAAREQTSRHRFGRIDGRRTRRRGRETIAPEEAMLLALSRGPALAQARAVLERRARLRQRVLGEPALAACQELRAFGRGRGPWR